jgi:hypothetical protein
MPNLLERNAQINALRNRMKEELDQWVKENDVLFPGETLYFALDVVKHNSKQPPKATSVKKIPTPPAEFIGLSKADWEKILAVDWSDEQLPIIKKLRKTGNSVTRFRYRPHSKRKQTLVYGNWSSCDYRFRKFKLPFRLAILKSGHYGYTTPGDHNSYYEDLYFQIWTKPVTNLATI